MCRSNPEERSKGMKIILSFKRKGPRFERFENRGPGCIRGRLLDRRASTYRRLLLRFAIHPDTAFLFILLLQAGDEDGKHLLPALLEQCFARLVEVLSDLVARWLLLLCDLRHDAAVARVDRRAELSHAQVEE